MVQQFKKVIPLVALRLVVIRTSFGRLLKTQVTMKKKYKLTKNKHKNYDKD